jgi:hypothetical protein
MAIFVYCVLEGNLIFIWLTFDMSLLFLIFNYIILVYFSLKYN